MQEAFCAFSIAFKTVEKHVLRRSFRLIDLDAAGEELADILETFRWVSYQAFEVIDPSSCYRWLLTSSLGAAGKCEEILARVNCEVDQVLHHLRHLVAFLPRAGISTLLSSAPR